MRLKNNSINIRPMKYNSFISQNISDAIVTTDLNFNINYANDKAALLFGIDRDELPKREIRFLLNETQLPFDIITKLISDENYTSWTGDIDWMGFQNKNIRLNVTVYVLDNAQGNTVGFSFLFKDVTALLTNEKHLMFLNENLNIAINKKIAQMDDVLSRITDAFIAFDNEWNYIYVNKKAAALYGMSIEDILDRNIKEVTPDIESYSLYHEMIRSKQSNTPLVVELKHPNADQWFEDWIYPDEHGVSVYYRDITQRKRNEAALEESQYHLEKANERFEMIARAVNEALWDWDMVNNIVWGNDKYYRMIESPGIFYNNLELFSSRIHPEDYANNMKAMEHCFEKKEEFFSAEYRFRLGNDQWINILNRQTIIYDKENGQPVRSLGSLMDITELKQIQEKIIYEKELSDSLINTLPGVFYMFDSDFKMTRWNQNILNITGYTDEEMAEMHPAAFVPEYQRDLIAGKIESVFVNGYDNIEADLLTKDQRTIPFFFTGIKTVFEGKTYLMGVGIDVSEAVSSKEQLRLLAKHLQEIREEERSNMSREIHDELGQQLTGLKMNVAWLYKKIETDQIEVKQKMQDTLSLVDDTVKSMRRLASMLRPSMLDDLGLLATMEWQCEEFEKRYQIKTILRCNKPNLELEKEMATAIFRIFQEGLTNVAKHAHASSVQININIENRELQMSISDNGLGMESSQKNGTQTLGLLGIHERVIMFGGTFEILSELQNGTTLLVKIPLVA